MASYHDKFPRKDGPPPVLQEGGSKKIFNNQKDLITVTLDVGSFRRLWELAEAEGNRIYPSHAMPSSGALLRAVQAMRNAYWSVNEHPVVRKPSGRVLKSTRKSPDPAKVKRVVRKKSAGAATVIEARPEVPARSVRRIRPR